MAGKEMLAHHKQLSNSQPLQLSNSLQQTFIPKTPSSATGGPAVTLVGAKSVYEEQLGAGEQMDTQTKKGCPQMGCNQQQEEALKGRPLMAPQQGTPQGRDQQAQMQRNYSGAASATSAAASVTSETSEVSAMCLKILCALKYYVP